MNLIVSSIGQGLLWALLGLGLYLTFRILDFEDETDDFSDVNVKTVNVFEFDA